jgi:predicted nucleic acid-binding Zn ribbon protein
VKLLKWLTSLPGRLHRALTAFFTDTTCWICSKHIEGKGVETKYYGNVCSETCRELLEGTPSRNNKCFVCDQDFEKGEEWAEIGSGYRVHIGRCKELAELESIVSGV